MVKGLASVVLYSTRMAGVFAAIAYMSLSSLAGHFATSASDQHLRNFKSTINKLNTLNVTERSSEYKVELNKKKRLQ